MPINTDKAKNFIDAYLQYRQSTESPMQYHRWSIIGCLGALLRRNFWLEHGSFTVYPNLYVMLIGEAGARKSTAIKQAVKLLKETGYDNIAADKSSKEAFLSDLAGNNVSGFYDDDLENASGPAAKYRKGTTVEDIMGSMPLEEDKSPRCCLIAADEFNEFVGSSNMEFLTTLGNLWDYEGVFKQRLKSSRQVTIPDPTISMLTGNTHENFQIAFPAEAAGQGILSRMLFIYGKATGKKIAFPERPSEQDTNFLINLMGMISTECHGPASLTEEAAAKLAYIYEHWEPIKDSRLVSYGQRRFTQLLKLCLIYAASRVSREITLDDVILANTTLTVAEFDMPDALGEYGRGKNNDVINKILTLLEDALHRTDTGLTTKELYKRVRQDVALPDLGKIMQGLEVAGKVSRITVPGYSEHVIVPIKHERKLKVDGMYDMHLLWEMNL